MSNSTQHIETSGNMQTVSPKVPVDYMQGALWLAFVCHVGQLNVLFFFSSCPLHLSRFGSSTLSLFMVLDYNFGKYPFCKFSDSTFHIFSSST